MKSLWIVFICIACIFHSLVPYDSLTFKRSCFFENAMMLSLLYRESRPMKILWYLWSIECHEIPMKYVPMKLLVVWWRFHSITQHDYAVKLPWYLLIPIEYNPLKLLWYFHDISMIIILLWHCAVTMVTIIKKLCILLWRLRVTGQLLTGIQVL